MAELLAATNQLHLDIKHMREYNPEKYQESGFQLCGHCNGTGLEDSDINRACKICVGVGFVGRKEIDEYSVCPHCNGSGFEILYQNDVQDCSTCGGSGKITWVDAILNGIDMEKIW
jgi:DnaJ-class molecular chaperone